MTIRILTGDCREVLKTLADGSVDSIVTDPPYELGFMGKGWDSTGIANDPAMWAECLRVLKPGGHLLAFSGTRTYHRMVCAIEDAGFEIRDQIGWVYASGYPKSLDVSKQIDKAAGAEREVIAAGKPVKRMIPGADQNATGSWIKDNGREFVPTVTEPATEAARQWQGWGTALKPAWEPICVARKPLIGNVAANVLTHGTGAINVDACRIMQEGQEPATPQSARWPANLIHDGSEEVLQAFPGAPGQQADESSTAPSGKTSNVYGRMKREGEPSANSDNDGIVGFKMKPVARRLDTGSAARFFKECSWQDHDPQRSLVPTVEPSSCLQSVLGASVQSGAAIWASLAGIVSSDSKEPSTNVTPSESRTIAELVITAMAPIGSESSRASRHEKHSPCGSRVSVAVERKQTGTTTITANLYRFDGSVARATFNITPTSLDRGVVASRLKYVAKAGAADRGEGNTHTTVKPAALMQYLCRLVTPPGGTVLDPFAGSGSTLLAADREGFDAIGIELSPEYIEIARRRITGDNPLFAEVDGG